MFSSKALRKLALITMTIGTPVVCAAWELAGTPVCVEPNDQVSPNLAADGQGGAIIVWNDQRFGLPRQKIYVQRLNASGTAQWAADGVSLSDNLHFKSDPYIAPDGAGGAICTWSEWLKEGGPPNIYVQHVDASGALLWGIDGKLLSGAPNGRGAAGIVSDGAGGAIVAWVDSRAGKGVYEVYAQRLSASGQPMWTLDGLAITSQTGGPVSFVDVDSDGEGGVIVAWEEHRDFDLDIYVQRVSHLGDVLWAPNGVAMTTLFARQDAPAVVSDGDGGALVVWDDYRDPQRRGIYAGRVSADGVASWGPDGKPVCTVSGSLVGPTIVSDGAMGAIVSWSDSRNSQTTQADVYCQHLDPAGAALWQINGVAICDREGFQIVSGVVSDGMGGAFVTWVDQRGGMTEVYAQRVNAAGMQLWELQGRPISAGAEAPSSPVVVPDGLNGAIVTWQDSRAGNSDIYAASMRGDGPTDAQVSCLGAEAEPRRIRVRWQVATPGHAVTLYRRDSVAGWVRRAELVPDGAHVVTFEDRDVMPGRRYGYRLGVLAGEGELSLGEVWIETPGENVLAFSRIQPNPATRDLTVRYSLPSSRPATLELFDVNGRRLRSLPLSPEAGPHVVTIDSTGDGERLPDGAYLLRLTQSERTVTTKVVLRR